MSFQIFSVKRVSLDLSDGEDCSGAKAATEIPDDGSEKERRKSTSSRAHEDPATKEEATWVGTAEEESERVW